MVKILAYYDASFDCYVEYFVNFEKYFLLINVAIISKQTTWLFWNNFTNGNINNGKYSQSAKIGDQCANTDNILCKRKYILFKVKTT